MVSKKWSLFNDFWRLCQIKLQDFDEQAGINYEPNGKVYIKRKALIRYIAYSEINL